MTTRSTVTVLLLALGVAGPWWSAAPHDASARPGATPLGTSLSDGSHTRLSNWAVPYTNLWNEPAGSGPQARSAAVHAPGGDVPAGNGLQSVQSADVAPSRLQSAARAWTAIARPAAAQRWWASEAHAVANARPASAIRFSPTRAPPFSMWAAASPASSTG